MKKWDNKEFRNAAMRKYRDTMKGKYNQWKVSAKKSNHEWHLTLADLENIPMVCHYSGLEMTMEQSKYNTISIDRIDSAGHYTKDNVVFCCADINRMKQEFTVSHLFFLCKKIIEHESL